MLDQHSADVESELIIGFGEFEAPSFLTPIILQTEPELPPPLRRAERLLIVPPSVPEEPPVRPPQTRVTKRQHRRMRGKSGRKH